MAAVTDAPAPPGAQVYVIDKASRWVIEAIMPAVGLVAMVTSRPALEALNGAAVASLRSAGPHSAEAWGWLALVGLAGIGLPFWLYLAVARPFLWLQVSTAVAGRAVCWRYTVSESALICHKGKQALAVPWSRISCVDSSAILLQGLVPAISDTYTISWPGGL